MINGQWDWNPRDLGSDSGSVTDLLVEKIFFPLFFFLFCTIFLLCKILWDQETKNHKKRIDIILPMRLGKRTNKQNSSSLLHLFLSTRALEVFKEGFVTTVRKKPRTLKKTYPCKSLSFYVRKSFKQLHSRWHMWSSKWSFTHKLTCNLLCKTDLLFCQLSKYNLFSLGFLFLS